MRTYGEIMEINRILQYSLTKEMQTYTHNTLFHINLI